MKYEKKKNKKKKRKKKGEQDMENIVIKLENNRIEREI